MKKGFTVVELLFLVAIVAILAAMLMPALSRAKKEARSAASTGFAPYQAEAALPGALPSADEELWVIAWPGEASWVWSVYLRPC